MIILLFISAFFLSAEEPPKNDLILTPISLSSRTLVILGRPTDRSVVMNICPDVDGELAVEYGIASGAYSKRTAPVRVQRDNPCLITLDGLTPDTGWYYRVVMRTADGETVQGREFSFHTQRPRGSAFTFIIEADPHLDGNSSVQLYTNVLARMAAEHADFFIDLGDTFMSEKLNPQNEASVIIRHKLFRPLLETVAASSPLFIALGNHEAEFGWTDKKLTADLPRWAFNARSRWYPNPAADPFYMTDKIENDMQNYYAWEWGDALVVVIDPYRYTLRKPGSRGGSDNWLCTLGEKQYRWMRSVLEGSSAPFKFVFAHQLVGGSTEGGRGGVEFAPYYEWGGQNKDGTEGFDQRRPGWGKPIHQVFVDTGVSVFFHGHDHLYVKQELDGVVYQACPQPSAQNTMQPSYAADYGYTSGTIIGNSGYLRVSVISPGTSRVEYIRASFERGRGSSKLSWSVADTYELSARKR